MNQKIDLFEEKIRAAMTQPAPGIGFKQDLWETIQQSYQTDPERRPVMEKRFWRNAKPFRWGLAISFVLMLAAIFLSLRLEDQSLKTFWNCSGVRRQLHGGNAGECRQIGLKPPANTALSQFRLIRKCCISAGIRCGLLARWINYGRRYSK